MKIMLDARMLGEAEKAQEYLSKKLQLPDYYGRNLDALYDSLTEMAAVELLVEHAGAAGPYYQKLKHVFEQAAEENPDLRLCEK